VIFVPPGTFRLTGVITDPMTPSGPIKEARVQVLAGTGLGLFGFTGDDGRFLLFGVAGDVELRITKEGYHARSEAFTVNQHTTRNIDLARVGATADVSGTYTLRISAADTCTASLPADAMLRTYSANVEQVGAALTIRVGDATFARASWWVANVIRDGRASEHGVTLSFGSLGCGGYYYGCGPSVLEQLSPTRFYLPTGRAELHVTPTMLNGELNGAIEIHEGNAVPGATRTAGCTSRHHQITFTR
jgi:hypothetical protein